MNTIRTPQHQPRMTRTVVVALIALLLVVATVPVLAMPRDPIDPPPVGGDIPYTAPDNGFEWSVPSRFGLRGSDGIINFRWFEDDEIYDPNYVNPTDFPVNFDGCRTLSEEDTGTSENTYTWAIDGEATSEVHCRFQHIFHQQGTYTVDLTITQPDGTVVLDTQGRGDPFSQQIVVKDLLIVSIGDSYASGEGNPDVPQHLNGSDAFGQPIYVYPPPRWQDRRCHRSAHAAPAQAARMLETVDRHTSVTFLSFACSGATIDTRTFADASIFDPYRSPEAYGWTKNMGTGILGPYSGREAPDPNRPQDNQLPSQLDQLMFALTNGGQLPARPVDALIVSGGGNDIGFGTIASLCILFYDCSHYQVEDYRGWGLSDLRIRVQQDINTLPALYTDLATEINDHVPFTANGRVYITEYPDLSRDSGGGFCSEMLEDVIPWWMAPILDGWSLIDGASAVPLPPYRMDADEASWAGGTVGPALNSAIALAAQTHGWILVDGINDQSANLFSGHGYCAADNWIRTATESVNMQGPWVPWNATLIPPGSAQTTGTLHPTTRGHLAIAERIVDTVRPFLLPPTGIAATPPTFTISNDNAIVGANGWLTGHAAGVACPGIAANCAFAQVVATSAANSAISGANLLVNGAPVACSASGTTEGGLTCQAQLTAPESYNWSLAFAADGVYQLAFTASSTNGASSSFAPEVNVDLTDPLASHEISSSPNAAGWYRIPVSITVTAADGAGSGPASIEYTLDGNGTTVDGNRAGIDVLTDGLHTLKYRAADIAGRQGLWRMLAVQVDQTRPSTAATVSPAANANGWHSTSSVAVTLSPSDGGSGVASLTYKATGAQPIVSTTSDGEAPVQLAITAEGETTIAFFARDVAGNVEMGRSMTVRIDRSGPKGSCAAADDQWYGNNVSIACTAADSGAGLASPADASFNLVTAVPPGSETDNAATGSRQVCDALGNCTTFGPVSGNKVDRKAPVIVVTTPAVNGDYLLNEIVAADYSCSDAGSGIATCSGAVPSGSAIDTASAGNKSFTVAATDSVGNAATLSTAYRVGYNLCVLYDQTKSYKLGSTVPIKLQLCDVDGHSVSAETLVVHATGVAKLDNTAAGELADAGNANPDDDFRFDVASGIYIYNLSTKGLTTGTWALSFTVSGDPLIHTVRFDLK